MSANTNQWEERFASGKAAICLVNSFAAKSENKEALNKYIQELFNDEVVLKVSRDEEYRVRLLGKEMHLQGISSDFLH
jgi:acetylglutamate synthase